MEEGGREKKETRYEQDEASLQYKILNISKGTSVLRVLLRNSPAGIILLSPAIHTSRARKTLPNDVITAATAECFLY